MSVAMRRELDALFSPRSVALVGASAHPKKMGNIALRNLSEGRFRLYPVNPKEKKILGMKCYPSMSEIPETVDLAVVSLPAEASIEPARECARIGVPMVIVTSSGFRESGAKGALLEQKLAHALEGSGTRLLGPNTMGIFVPSTGLDTLFIPKDRSVRPPKGSLSLLSQSGAVSVAFMEKAEAAGVGLYASVGLGNKTDLDENDLVDYLTSSKGTKSIALYLESFSDGRRFLEACKNTVRTKPIVVLKSGRTATGSRAAGSHTGALASRDSVVDGALRQSGAIRAYDEEELLDIAKALDFSDHIGGGRICVVASAGGFGVITADYIESKEHGIGLSMAIISKKGHSELRKVVPEFSSVSNPVDLTAGVTDEMYDSVLDILQGERGVDCVLMSLELQPPNVTRELLKIAERHARRGRVPLVLSVFAGKRTESVMREFSRRRIPAYPTIWRAVRAVGALAQRGRFLRSRK